MKYLEQHQEHNKFKYLLNKICMLVSSALHIKLQSNLQVSSK